MPSSAKSLVIDRLGARGDGVALLDGRDVFVAFALLGERVTAKVEADRGRLLELESASADRIVPICRHFGTCGGCAMQHLAAPAYRAWKRGLVVDALADRGIETPVGDLVVMPIASRRRAVFAARKSDGGVVLGFHTARDQTIIDLTECPVLVPEITSRLSLLRKLVGAAIASGVEAKVTVTVFDHGLDIAIEDAGVAQGQKRFAELATLVGQGSGIVRISVDGETVLRAGLPVLTLDGVAIEPPPGGFLQAVAAAETFIAGEISKALAKLPRKAKVADLYAGVGVFSFAAAKHLSVDAFEIEQSAVDALIKAAAAAKGRRPIQAYRRDLVREPLSFMELRPYAAAIVDPPRAGADGQAKALAKSKVGTVVMVSCNPGTLARDLRTLIDGGYRLKSVVPIDQFLYSAHTEVVAVLTRE